MTKRKRGIYFNFPSWANPHIDKQWLRDERDDLIEKGEWDVWEREYGARRVPGGSNAIFPRFQPPDKQKGILHTAHVRPHAELMAEISRDKRRLHWQAIADPGTTSVFAVLFRAINPYTRRVYRLAEIYEKDMKQTSTSLILPRIRELREELCPGWEVLGIDWQLIYDEAAAWFAAEIMASFEDEPAWAPTKKGTKDKNVGLSLQRDQMIREVEERPGAFLTVVSDQCVNFIKETVGYIRDKDGKIPKKNDHLLDCDRYGNDYAVCDLAPVKEPEPVAKEDERRGYTPEQDAEAESYTEDFGLDDF